MLSTTGGAHAGGGGPPIDGGAARLTPAVHLTDDRKDVACDPPLLPTRPSPARSAAAVEAAAMSSSSRCTDAPIGSHR
eukprot:scaffold242290_cov31-Tisochrysis_lutea.AAC.2